MTRREPSVGFWNQYRLPYLEGFLRSRYAHVRRELDMHSTWPAARPSVRGGTYTTRAHTKRISHMPQPSKVGRNLSHTSNMTLVALARRGPYVT